MTNIFCSGITCTDKLCTIRSGNLISLEHFYYVMRCRFRMNLYMNRQKRAIIENKIEHEDPPLTLPINTPITGRNRWTKFDERLANNSTKHNLIWLKKLPWLLQYLQYFASTLLLIDALHLVSVWSIDTLDENLMKESHNLTLTISHCLFTGSGNFFQRKAFARIFIDFLQNVPSALCLYHVCHLLQPLP